MDEARRQLLRLGTLTAACAALPLEALGEFVSEPVAASSLASNENEYDALSNLTAADFKPFVGAVFKAQSEASGSASVVLVEVQCPPKLGKPAKNPATSQHIFALRFKSVSGKPLKQGTYVFQHKALGNFALFVVPSAAGAKPMYYTGQINRSVQ